MDDFEDKLEHAFWDFDAMHKGYGEWRNHPQSERDAFKQVIRELQKHSVYFNPELEHLAEEAECAHMILDDMDIPRGLNGEKYSLVGRIQCIITNTSSTT